MLVFLLLRSSMCSPVLSRHALVHLTHIQSITMFSMLALVCCLWHGAIEFADWPYILEIILFSKQDCDICLYGAASRTSATCFFRSIPYLLPAQSETRFLLLLVLPAHQTSKICIRSLCIPLFPCHNSYVFVQGKFVISCLQGL